MARVPGFVQQRDHVVQRNIGEPSEREGDLDNAKVGTIRNYLAAIGGELALEYVIGDQRMRVA